MKSIELLQTSSYAAVRRRAEVIREHLGSAIPERDPAVASALNTSVDEYDGSGNRQFEKDLFLWLAGPYKWDGGWLVAPPNIAKQSTKELIDRKNQSGLIENSLVQETLTRLKIQPAHHHAWIKRLDRFVGNANGLVLSAAGRTGT